jgi:hypothetical protein
MAGPVWVEDDSIGRALAGLADSFSGKSGAYIANVRSEIAAREDQRRKLQQELLAKQREQEAADAAIAARRSRLMDIAPPTPAQTGWATGAGPIGAEVVPPGGPAPLQTYDAAIIKPQDAAAAKTFGLERESQLANYALAARNPSAFATIAKGAPEMAAQAQIALTGVPKTVDEQAKLQTQLTGQLPLTDQKSATGYAVLNADGQVVGRGVTHNFRTDASGAAINVPPGGSIVKMGEMSAEAGPLKDEGAMRATIDRGLQKVARGEPIGQPEALTIAQALSKQFPDVVRLEKDDVGNVRPVVMPEHPMGKVYGPLVDQLNRAIGGTTTAAPAAAAAFGAGAQPMQNPTVPGVTLPTTPPPEVSNIGGTAGLPATPAPTTTPEPIITPPAAGVTAQVGAPVIRGTGSELQKELFNSQFYRQYSDSMTAYNNVRDAMKSDNQSADLRAIYALAKLYDPGSVVREGELRLTQGASSLAERMAGLYNALSGSGGRLTPSQRADIMAEAYGAARQQYESMNVKNRDAADRAQRLGIDPSNVTVPMQVPEPPRPEEISSIKRGGRAGAQPLSRGATPAAPAAGATMTLDGKNYRKDPTTGKWFEVR